MTWKKIEKQYQVIIKMQCNCKELRVNMSAVWEFKEKLFIMKQTNINSSYPRFNYYLPHSILFFSRTLLININNYWNNLKMYLIESTLSNLSWQNKNVKKIISSTLKVRIPNAYLNLRFTEKNHILLMIPCQQHQAYTPKNVNLPNI